MRYDLVRIKGIYRGMARTLLGTDLLNSNTEKQFKELLEEYFEFIEYSEIIDEISFNKTIEFYVRLKEYDISCEVIVYHNTLLENAYGYELEFLGIDIVHDMCESLIEEIVVDSKIEELINENGLCCAVDAVNKVISYYDHGGVEWSPCYVYKVLV